MSIFTYKVFRNTMNFYKTLILNAILILASVISVRAQYIEAAISPLTLAYQNTNYHFRYNNSYSFLVEFSMEDEPSDLLYSLRYEAFDGNFYPEDRDNRSFENLGVGVRYKLARFYNFGTSAFGNVGILLSDPYNKRRASVADQYDTVLMANYRSPMPSLVNLTVGGSFEWYASSVAVPYVELAVISSFKLQENEATRFEIFATRLGVRFII